MNAVDFANTQAIGSLENVKHVIVHVIELPICNALCVPDYFPILIGVHKLDDAIDDVL